MPGSTQRSDGLLSAAPRVIKVDGETATDNEGRKAKKPQREAC